MPADDAFKQRYMDENERLASQGLRVMATGRKDFDPDAFDPSADLLPLLDGLTVLALVGIVDPPRPTAKAAIAIAHEAGIQVRMITGDHAVTAAAIAKELGIPGRAITGAEFKAMSDDELDAAIDDIGVIARVAPEDKVRLVESLKRKGDIVAMTGDGVNDAPALKSADIGIAMGITGTEVSKEAATMILTDDNFATIVKAVELGRGLYDNLTKYIRFQMGVLVGFIVTFLGASIFNIVGGVPFVPLQTLYVNFTTQVLQAIGLGYGRPAEGLMKRKPRASDEPILPRPLLIWVGDRGARARRGHARRDRAGPTTTTTQRSRAHDGADDVRDQQRRLLAHHARRAALGVLARRARGQDVHALHRRLARRDPARHRARGPPADPRHRPPRPAPVARLHRRRARDRARCPRPGGCCSSGAARRAARPTPTAAAGSTLVTVDGNAMTTASGGTRTPRAPTLLDALLPVVVLIGLIALTIWLFGVSATDGPLQVALLLSAAFACLMALKNGYTSAAIADAAIGGVTTAMSAIFILLAVGALIGTWNMAGTIPTVVDYGVRLLNPTIFFVDDRGDLRGRRHGYRQLVDDRRHARRRVRRDVQGHGPLRGGRRRRCDLRRVLRRQDDAALGDDDPRAQAGRPWPHDRAAHPEHVLDGGPGARHQPRHLPRARPERRADWRGEHAGGARRAGELSSTSPCSTCCRSRCSSCSRSGRCRRSSRSWGRRCSPASSPASRSGRVVKAFVDEPGPRRRSPPASRAIYAAMATGFVSKSGNAAIDQLFSRGGMASLLTTDLARARGAVVRRDHGARRLPRAAPPARRRRAPRRADG